MKPIGCIGDRKILHKRCNVENQYMWLYNHLEKYQFNTDKAKELQAEFGQIQLLHGEVPNEETMQKLKDCYYKLFDLLDNNPFSYINGLREAGVETNDLDCYFIENNGQMVPIGYYKIKHPIESILLLNKKIQAQKEKTFDTKKKLMGGFEKEAERIQKTYDQYKTVNQSNYFRAGLATFASIMILVYTILFLKITNIVDIIKGIGDKKRFTMAVYDGMSRMPIFEKTGIVMWVLFLILHIATLIYVVIYIKEIKNEYVLTYQRVITSKYKKTSDKSVGKVNQQFDELLEKDSQNLLDLMRKGMTSLLEKNVLSQIIKKLRKRMSIAKGYLSKEQWNMRGIQKNGTIAILVLLAGLGCFTYTIMAKPDVKQVLDKWDYSIRLAFSSDKLRGVKLVQLTKKDSQIYSSKSEDSKVKYILPEGTTVEVLKKELVGEEEWSKIKKVTETEVITGWILTSDTKPYNETDYSQYYEIPVASYESSSNLVGQLGEYNVFYAVDWNRETAWQDGNQGISGEGEFIRVDFEKETTIDMILIFPGNAKSEELYWKNERIKKAEISFSNDQSFTYEFDDSFEEEYQTIRLNKPISTSYMFVEILEVYEGQEFMDSCISEVHVFGKRENIEEVQE